MRYDLTAKGSYLLVMNMGTTQEISVGKLGTLHFSAGFYVYAGSAHGPGGVQARLLRHKMTAKKKHWHIDSLRPECEIISILACFDYDSLNFQSQSVEPLECIWSQALQKISGLSIPVAGFGSSDCQSACRSHLLYHENLSSDEVLHILKNLTPGIFEVEL